jgi:hypothetical protein
MGGDFEPGLEWRTAQSGSANRTLLDAFRMSQRGPGCVKTLCVQ